MNEKEMLKSILYNSINNQYYLLTILQLLVPRNDIQTYIKNIQESTDNVWNKIWEEAESSYEVSINKTNE